MGFDGIGGGKGSSVDDWMDSLVDILLGGWQSPWESSFWESRACLALRVRVKVKGSLFHCNAPANIDDMYVAGCRWR